jgi:cytoskeletal protein CcmA (bactofilin family)
MSRFDRPAVRVLLGLTILVAGILGLTDSVRADSIVIEGDTIPAGTVVDNDVIITGEAVVIDGDVLGDVFAFGNTVAVNGTIDGSLVTVSSEVTINGSVTGTVYVLAGILELGPTATTDRNVLVASVRLVTERGSVVGRDLHAISIGGQLNGRIGRDTNATIGVLEIIDVIRNSISRGPGGSAALEGILRIADIRGPYRAAVPAAAEDGTRVNANAVVDWILARVLELILLLVVAGLFLWLRPTLLHKSVESVRRAPFPAAGLGLLAYISGFVGAVLLAVFLVFISIALLVAVSWKSAALVWALGSSSLFLAVFCFVVFVYYISKVIVGLLVGKLILRLISPRRAGSNLLALLIGLTLYVLLVPIPVLGWLLAFVMSLLGLGSMWLVFLDNRRTRDESAIPESQGPITEVGGPPIPVGELREVPNAEAVEARQLGEKLAREDIEARLATTQGSSGPWRFVEIPSLPDATLVDKASRAVSDVLAPSKEFCVSYIATVDSDGNPLRGGGEYEVTGRELDARWWSITAYDPEHLIANERSRYSVSRTAAAESEDGEWIVRVTSKPRDDDTWIHSGDTTIDLALVLRLYGASKHILDDMAAVELPDIRPIEEPVVEEGGDETNG